MSVEYLCGYRILGLFTGSLSFQFCFCLKTGWILNSPRLPYSLAESPNSRFPGLPPILAGALRTLPSPTAVLTGAGRGPQQAQLRCEGLLGGGRPRRPSATGQEHLRLSLALVLEDAGSQTFETEQPSFRKVPLRGLKQGCPTRAPRPVGYSELKAVRRFPLTESTCGAGPLPTPRSLSVAEPLVHRGSPCVCA